VQTLGGSKLGEINELGDEPVTKKISATRSIFWRGLAILQTKNKKNNLTNNQSINHFCFQKNILIYYDYYYCCYYYHYYYYYCRSAGRPAGRPNFVSKLGEINELGDEPVTKKNSATRSIFWRGLAILQTTNKKTTWPTVSQSINFFSKKIYLFISETTGNAEKHGHTATDGGGAGPVASPGGSGLLRARRSNAVPA